MEMHHPLIVAMLLVDIGVLHNVVQDIMLLVIISVIMVLGQEISNVMTCYLVYHQM